MGVMDIFSKRQRRMRGEVPDVYKYDDLPSGFRTQVVFILGDVFTPIGDPYHAQIWRTESFKAIHDGLARELGVFLLTAQEKDPRVGLIEFFLSTKNVDDALSVIETSLIVGRSAQQPRRFLSFKMTVDDAVKELNTRFSEHGIGYQFESFESKIVRVDSQFLHQAVVKPALQLLKAHYAGANEEFRKAHEHYRKQRYSEAVNECLKALESTLKIICKKRKWAFDEKRDAAQKLLQIVFKQELIPAYLQSQFASLKSVIESGVPTIRNRESGHGAGEEPRHIPQHLAAYVLHLTASAIVFISRCDDEF